MSHKRTQIRQYFMTVLTGLPSTNDRVYTSWVYPFASQTDLPTLRVVTGSEAREDGVQGGPPYAQGRSLDVIVEARAKGDNFADALDQNALEVETAVMADPYLGGLAEWCELADTTPDSSGDMEEGVGLLSLTFNVRYRVDAQNPQ